ncbi:hypothetical protein ACFLXD_06120 [Chloroflexota bacterium]
MLRIIRQREEMKRETGFAILETLVAIALLGIIAVAFLSAMATASKAHSITDERAIAESLVRSEVEYVKSLAYQYSATEYPVDPSLTVPQGWTIPPPTVSLVHATDDGVQKVTATAERNGESILSIVLYKVDR